MPKTLKKLSHMVVWLLVLISYIPMLTLFALMDESRIFMYSVTIFWLIVFLLLKFPQISLPSLRQAKTIRFFLFMLLTTIGFLLICKYLGFSFNLNLEKVYEIRAKYTEMKIPFAGYLFNWIGYVVNPVFFAFFLNKRKWIYVMLVIALQLFLFSGTGNKTFLFALPFVLFLMWIVTCKKPFVWITVSLISVILLGMLSYWLINDVWLFSLSARRTLLVPAQLSFFYYDFFSKNEYTFLSQHRIFRNFIDYPYHLDPPHLLGEIYFNRPECNANNGIYGDAYMNFGFIGLILWAILIVIILKLIDSFSKNKELKTGIAALAMPVIALVNSPLLTCLLTHGLLLGLIFLWLLPKGKNNVY